MAVQRQHLFATYLCKACYLFYCFTRLKEISQLYLAFTVLLTIPKMRRINFESSFTSLLILASSSWFYPLLYKWLQCFLLALVLFLLPFFASRRGKTKIYGTGVKKGFDVLDLIYPCKVLPSQNDRKSNFLLIELDFLLSMKVNLTHWVHLHVPLQSHSYCTMLAVHGYF